MNWDQIAGNWKQMTGRIRQEWSKLSESDIDNAKGNRDSLIGKIQERYGVARDEAEFLIEYLSAGSISDGRVATTASNVTPYPSATINRQADGATVDNAYALGGMKEMGNLLLVFVEPTATELLWRVRISKVIEDANRINEQAVRRAVRQGLATLPEAP